MIRHGTNNKIKSRQDTGSLLRSWMSGGESGVRSRALGRVRDSGTGAQLMGDRETGPGSRGSQTEREREISAVRTGVWATHAACLHCRHCSDDSMETRGLTPH